MALRKIIVGCDGSDGAHDALRLAALLGRADRAELILASVYRHDRDHAVALLAEAERSVPYGTRASMRAIEARSPSRALRDLADSEGADLIVIGACNKRGQSSFATGAHCPVAVAPRGLADDPDPGLRVIGVAFDAPPESRAAVEVAAELALAAHATLKLIGIAESPPPPTVGMTAVYSNETLGDYRAALLGEMENVADELPLSLRTQVVLADGDPAPQLVERAEQLSLLVTGSRGYGPVRRAVLGSVSAQVLRALPCPVLVVPRGVGEVHRAAA